LFAFVEIVFENSDLRMPTGSTVCAIRRTIWAAREEWHLDQKIVTRQEIIGLLQAAGFSRSNPYFIVPQGRISALTVARDAERLALLKEVAGTRVYEEHRAESVRIMDETGTDHLD
jgi:structural maintenance of chromosome 3 (chondroitin sulfate proteoglycan 6)